MEDFPLAAPEDVGFIPCGHVAPRVWTKVQQDSTRPLEARAWKTVTVYIYRRAGPIRGSP